MSTTESSIAARTVMSYLEDIDRHIKELDHMDAPFERENLARRLFSVRGDLWLADSEASKADSDEEAALHAMCYSRRGQIKWSLAEGFRKYAGVKEANQKINTYLGEAAEEFACAIRFNPRPYYYYSFGLICTALKRDWEARQALEVAANGDDEDVALEARKELGRIGTVSPPKGTALVSSGGSVVEQFGTRKVTSWGLVKTGGITTVVGLVLYSTGMGIPIVLVGILIIILAVVNGKQVY